MADAGRFTDERGTLVAFEFAEVPFTIRRIFTVTAPPGGADRGDHAVLGEQLIVLVSGSATIRNGQDADDPATPVTLDEPGERLRVSDGSYIRYRLHDDRSTILVLCEQPFVSRS